MQYIRIYDNHSLLSLYSVIWVGKYYLRCTLGLHNMVTCHYTVYNQNRIARQTNDFSKLDILMDCRVITLATDQDTDGGQWCGNWSQGCVFSALTIGQSSPIPVGGYALLSAMSEGDTTSYGGDVPCG